MSGCTRALVVWKACICDGFGSRSAICEALVRMHIDARYDNFPADTFASIYTAGLPGEQVITLEASGLEETLEAGGHTQMTQSALVLEQVIGQFLVDGRGRDRR